MKGRFTVVLCMILILAMSLLGGFQSLASQPLAGPPPPGILALGEKDDGFQFTLAESDVLVLSLPANISTGYSWEVTAVDRGVLRQVGDIDFEAESSLLGAPGVQKIRFVGVSEGKTPLNLVYRRSWKRDVEALDTFSVNVQSKGAFMGVYEAEALPVVEILPEEEPAPLALPSSFNWCDQGGCTPVKNQGSCGSCWAFGTVGPFESAIKIQDGVTRDLAEQYLVSCNAEGWGCNGGWWAHDYHEWKYVSGESGPGAVYESDFRYVAADVPCNPPHPHPYILDSWTQITSGDASTSVLKQAIYDHGPLSVAVCANSAMSSYSGGIFTGPSCTSVNHAVVLTGWNDSGQYWHMKNSWGTGWGESGYMRIGWGVSRIGYRPAYVVYDGGPAPTPTPTRTPTSPPPTPTRTPTSPPPTPTSPPGNVVFFDDFESSQGWVVDPNSNDTATTGMWERANPEGTSYSGVDYQLGTTVSGSYDLVTEGSAGSSVGSYDIDGGDTTIRSPNITLPSSGDVTLSFSYYLAHYTNAASDDYLRVKVVGSTTQTVFEELGAGNTDAATWDTFSTSLNSFRGQTVYLLIEAADGGGGSLVEAAVDDVLVESSEVPPPTPTPTTVPPTPTPTGVPPTPTPTSEPGQIFFDDFESSQGWVVDPNSNDTATTGLWERANPEGTSYSGVNYQLGTTVSGSYDLVTEGSAGSSVGSYDIDGGDTTIRSPNITLPSSGDVTLSFSYYLAHYSNAASDDYLRVKVVGSTTQTVFEELGAGNTDAAVWDTFSTSLNSFRGQTIYLLIEAADGGGGSLVEAAIDDVSITSN